MGGKGTHTPNSDQDKTEWLKCEVRVLCGGHRVAHGTRPQQNADKQGDRARAKAKQPHAPEQRSREEDDAKQLHDDYLRRDTTVEWPSRKLT